MTKTVRSQQGELSLNIPRDRNATFEPQLIGKGERTLKG
ncbi:transposase, partial [Providencia rettgeri]